MQPGCHPNQFGVTNRLPHIHDLCNYHAPHPSSRHYLRLLRHFPTLAYCSRFVIAYWWDASDTSPHSPPLHSRRRRACYRASSALLPPPRPHSW